jgi:hypothetical protein
VDPVPDPLLRKSGGAGNRTRDLWICSHEHSPLTEAVDERMSQAEKQHEEITNQSQPIHAALLTGSLFENEDGDMFLRNVGLLSIGYIALYSRRQNSPN